MMTLGENCKVVDTCIQNGKGECHIKHLTDKAAMYDNARMFAHVTIPAGCSIGDHPHNGEEKTVHAGDICATGYGEVHGIENVGSEDLEMIALIVLEK